MGFDIYFHTKKVEDECLILGVQVYEDGVKYEPLIKEVDLVRGATFFEEELESFLLALDVIETEEFDDVVLHNQNGLLFKWLGNETHENQLRNEYYKNIKSKMTDIVTNNETSIGYKIIKGNKNEAKKEIVKYEKDRVSAVKDITDLFKPNKVVPFNRKAK